MNNASDNQAPEELTHFDENTPQSIIQLDKKLREMKSEVEMKLNDPSSYTGDDKEVYFQKLSKLSEEINEAIKSLEALVKMVDIQDEEFKKDFYESDVMKEFNESVTKSFDKLPE
ncbi:TPA: hypothetical protein RG395_001550 [Legionella pneumophila]|uniref:hypothetical protein n=1 Tax=Legionella pneumophila TaxID=446 RepID=UPI00078878DE|nr:hypothetical protein [Legionella pneumophila]MDW8879257.1 hypothetical protein [Legionella pneumophila subsp. fraseri]MDW8961735.1 hypothetical protein [Legionella pneumophila subsp. fraseri]MDW9035723.1 hypothetical protein [Legionella pneumophila subsp. fraseri]MDW9039080.1 hypothetical protein [Legionella pneumophila subsp. fraseri]MDW9041928.1 hypothetical protein [Legionella pneumophila subsp. fraseri]